MSLQLQQDDIVYAGAGAAIGAIIAYMVSGAKKRPLAVGALLGAGAGFALKKAIVDPVVATALKSVPPSDPFYFGKLQTAENAAFGNNPLVNAIIDPVLAEGYNVGFQTGNVAQAAYATAATDLWTGINAFYGPDLGIGLTTLAGLLGL